MVKLAINGFGRIGRNAFKIAFDRNDAEIVAVNDLTDTKTLAHLLKYDSNYGIYAKDVSFDDESIIVDGKHIRVFSEKEPGQLPWRDLGIDVVVESTGLFTDPEKAAPILMQAPKKSSSLLPPKAKAPKLLSLASTKTTLRLMIKSFPMLLAPPTVLHQS